MAATLWWIHLSDQCFPRTEQSVSPVVEQGAWTVTLRPAVAVLLAASAVEFLTSVVPSGKVDPEAGSQSTGTPPETRSSAVYSPCTFNHA